MASSTWEGSREPEVQADPLDAADAFHIQHDQQGLSLDELEAEVGVVRQTSGPVSVQSGSRESPVSNAVDQVISELALFGCTLFHGAHGTLYCFAKTYDTRNILCTGTALSLLCSAMDKGTDLHTLADIEEANALGAVESCGRWH